MPALLMILLALRSLRHKRLIDDNGIVRIDPQGASISDLQTFYRLAKPGDNIYYSKGPLSEIDNSVHRRRFLLMQIKNPD